MNSNTSICGLLVGNPYLDLIQCKRQACQHSEGAKSGVDHRGQHGYWPEDHGGLCRKRLFCLCGRT